MALRHGWPEHCGNHRITGATPPPSDFHGERPGLHNEVSARSPSAASTLSAAPVGNNHRGESPSPCQPHDPCAGRLCEKRKSELGPTAEPAGPQLRGDMEVHRSGRDPQDASDVLGAGDAKQEEGEDGRAARAIAGRLGRPEMGYQSRESLLVVAQRRATP